MVNQIEIHREAQSGNVEVPREFSLHKIEAHRLEEILSDIEKQRSIRVFGYILMPIILGFFILKKTNETIYILTKKKDELTYRVINGVETSNKQLKDTLKNLIETDIFLIYSVRTDLLSKLEEYLRTLHYLKLKHEYFENSFNNLIETSISEVIKSKITIENFNKELIERRKKEYEPLFKKSNANLNDEQKTAIITDDKHNLIVAGAGSGKTEVLITRIAYLMLRKQETIAPNRILALAFQNKAAKEIEERLSKKFGIEVKIKTFHSFGLEVLSNASLKPKLKFNGDNFELGYNEFIAELYKKTEKEPSFQNKLLAYMLHFGDEERIKQESDFEKKEEWYQYMQNLTYTALDGTKVKSEGERVILNFLFTHKINGKYIKVLYEHPAEWMNYKDGKSETKTPKPDFFLPDYNIYIEHWALDEKGNVPEWFDHEYKKGMRAKIERFKQQKKYSLVETTYGEFKNDNFIEHFEKKLIKEIKRKHPKEDVILSLIGYSELVERIWKTCKGSIERIPKDIATFIVKAKTNGLTPENIHERLEKEKWSPKQKAFAELALVIYKEYEKELQLTNEIDFTDMINQALVELEKNKSLYENSFDHVLIDEYQDISTQRYRLIKALMAKNHNCKLFCVGDDWQSIMGFTGSNLELFVKFQDYFDHPARTDLSINYRSKTSIVDAGAELIKYNGDAQIKKQTIANNTEEKKIIVFSCNDENIWDYYQQTAIHCANMVKGYLAKGYAPQDIMILYRIGKPRLITQLIEYAILNNVPIQINGRSPRSIPLMSVHKSKGLQAKVVE